LGGVSQKQNRVDKGWGRRAEKKKPGNLGVGGEVMGELFGGKKKGSRKRKVTNGSQVTRNGKGKKTNRIDQTKGWEIPSHAGKSWRGTGVREIDGEKEQFSRESVSRGAHKK